MCIAIVSVRPFWKDALTCSCLESFIAPFAVDILFDDVQ